MKIHELTMIVTKERKREKLLSPLEIGILKLLTWNTGVKKREKFS